ncbi:MAG: hypothetical protein M0R47_07060 [Methylobacter sp.]|uniref:hypothetical protein n=1 Tax=Methylobacter sp. TaxID=2051955 RepID=UPI0025E35A90|nr:hypothetical protein [Methylobacter sp.]MCK9620279.1 hypothetical protein [Methylobacter sp.]
MNLLNFIQKEFYAALQEANRPLFPEGSENDEHYMELFNFYHSLKGKTIDTRNGESLFPITIDNVYFINKEITKARDQKLPEASALADFEVKNWMPA